MKHITSILTASALFTATVGASIDWDGDTSVTSEGHSTWEIANAVQTLTPPAIDGVMSPGEWDAAPRYELNFTTHSSMDPSGLAAAFRVLWDETNIYMLIEGVDGMGIESAGHRFELYISTAYTRKFGQWMLPGYEDNDYQILATINPLDTFYSLGLYSEETPLGSFTRENTVDGASYISEIRIAWAELGGLPSERGLVNEDYIGFEVHVQRGTENNNRAKLAWAGVVDSAWAATEDWGTLRLLPAGDGNGGDPDTWYGYAVGEEGWVDTGTWMGWVNVEHDPFIYVLDLAGYLYVPTAMESGAWVYRPAR